MAFRTIYNQTYTTPVTVTDELKNNAGSGWNYVGDTRRAFKGSTDFVIRTASGGGGTLLVNGTDYSIQEDTVKSAVAGFAVYYRYIITNVTYQTGNIYISYECVGTYNYAANVLYVDDANNRIGVNQADPVSVLDVGNTNSANIITIGKGGTSQSGIEFNRAGTIDGGIYNTANEGLVFEIDKNAGLTTDGIAFKNNGAIFAKFSDEGKLGIGTSDPNLLLTIESTIGGRIALVRTDAAVGSGVAFGQFSCFGYDDISVRKEVSRINILADGAWTHGTSHPTKMYFHVTASGAEEYTATPAMVIKETNRVGLGTVTPGYQLELSTDSAGKPSTNTWTVVSDKRTKDNIELADLDICYNTVKNLPLKRWTWKDEIYSVDKVKDRTKIGWVADDVETVFPKAVDKHNLYKDRPEDAGEDYEDEILIPDCKNLNSDQIIAAMFGAIQKLQLMVEGLK